MSQTIDRRNTPVQLIINSAVETTLYTFSVPANTIGTTGILSGRAVFTYRQSSGVNQTITIREKWGGTTQIDDVSIVVPAAADLTDLRSLIIDFEIAGANATNAQRMATRLEISAIRASTAGTSGDWGTVPLMPPSTITAQATIDQTAARTLEITAQLSAATATQFVNLQYAYLQKL